MDYRKLNQQLKDQILAGLKWGSCLVYLDDLLVMASEFDVMLMRLRKVLERLSFAAMTLNPRKCSFGYREVQILGHTVNSQGISPNPDKIKAVQNFPAPRRLRAVRSFLGLCNYYRSFVPNFSKIVRPLVELTRNIFFSFFPSLPIESHTEASDFGVGAALMQA